MALFNLRWIFLLPCLFDWSSSAVPGTAQGRSGQRQILVFGGNGFLGASTVELLVKRGDNVTIVNRGNWYWDSKERIKPFVQVISCDRKNNVASCKELTDLITNLGSDKFDAVIDFSAYGPQEIKDATGLLRNKARFYIFISTDSVYDVCDRSDQGRPVKEEDAVRPDDLYRRDMLNSHHEYGHRKLEAEEALVKQRESEGDIPFVILRLPDVLGPRDTTYRFWIYQLWIKLAPILSSQPVTIPKFLVNYDNSFVYVDDVASIIQNLTQPAMPTVEAVDQVFNLAWHENITVEQLLRTIEEELGIEKQVFKIDEESNTMYLYPTVRIGPIDSSKAKNILGWNPTPFKDAIHETVKFYEEAIASEKFQTQRDEIIQVQSAQLYAKDKETFYDAAEKSYKLNLSHFRVHDEL